MLLFMFFNWLISPFLGGWMGGNEHLRCRETTPSKRPSRRIERMVRPPLRIMHPSLQLHHRLQLHLQLPSQLLGGIRRPGSRWQGPLQRQHGSWSHPHPMEKRVSMVRAQPSPRCRSSPRPEVLPQVWGVLQTRLLCWRALFLDYVDDWEGEYACE